MASLQGKVVWLTGASQGIGEALARRLATADCKLAISARRGDVLEKLAGELSRHGPVVRAYPCDVTDREAVSVGASRIMNDLGPVDVLITNAGTYQPTDAREFSATDHESIMRLNYGGTLNCIEAVLPSMISRRSGHVVGVSSLVGYRGLPRSSSYGASKAALINFLECFRFDVQKHGIKVTVVNPGFVKTPLTDRNDFTMPFLVPAERAAEIIIDGIRREKYEVHFPWQLSWIFKLMRIIPFPLYHALIGWKTARE